MSLWKKISLGVLIFIVLLLGTVAFLVGTTTGLHLLFNAANRWVPGLEIGQVVSPRLASVLTPRFEMGKVATEILIKKIKGLPTIEKVDLHYRLSMGETI